MFRTLTCKRRHGYGIKTIEEIKIKTFEVNKQVNNTTNEDNFLANNFNESNCTTFKCY